MKWIIRFFFFAVLIVVLVMAWMNPIKLWFSKPFVDTNEYITKIKYDSTLRIADSLQKEITNLKIIKEKQRYLVHKQERKIHRKVEEIREKPLSKNTQGFEQIIKEYEYAQIQYNDLLLTSDSIITVQSVQIETKDKLIELKDQQIKDYKIALENTVRQYQAVKYDLEFTNRKYKNQKRIGLVIIGILTLIAIK